jgi:putative FmdB family regulatory protein
MPLFEYQCESCGKVHEILLNGAEGGPGCPDCGSSRMRKLVSAHSSLSGTSSNRMPGVGDTGCCGTQPHQADCQGPGSCCGKSR